MILSTYHLDDDVTPYVMSIPPHPDAEGDPVDASITIYPFGKSASMASLRLSIDEAEDLARRLVEVVTNARAGQFSPEGVEITQGMREQNLKEAWIALGMEQPPEDDV